MSARGSYRAIHTVLIDGPDYQSLTPDAKLALLTLKLSLGPTGIDVMYTPVLEARTGMSSARVATALKSLVRGGWVRHERNVMWLVEGLAYEPSRSLTNANHVQEIVKHLEALPRLSIVMAFRCHYNLPGAIPPTDPDGMGDGIGEGMGDGMGEHGETENGRTEERKNGSLGASADAPSDHGGMPAGFAACWAVYPRRPNDSRKKALKAWQARVRGGAEPTTLLEGAERYARYCDLTGRTGTEYVKQAATFFGPDEHYLLPWEAEGERPAGAVPVAASSADDLLAAMEGAGLVVAFSGPREVYRARITALGEQLGRPAEEFRALVSQIKPWDLATVTFPPDRRREFARRLAVASAKVAA